MLEKQKIGLDDPRAIRALAAEKNLQGIKINGALMADETGFSKTKQAILFAVLRSLLTEGEKTNTSRCIYHIDSLVDHRNTIAVTGWIGCVYKGGMQLAASQDGSSTSKFCRFSCNTESGILIVSNLCRCI